MIFYTDKGVKRPLEDPDDNVPAKSSQNGGAGNSDPLPLGYHRELVPSVSKLYLKKNISTVKRNGQPITGASDFIWKEWAVRKFVLLKTK